MVACRDPLKASARGHLASGANCSAIFVCASKSCCTAADVAPVSRMSASVGKNAVLYVYTVPPILVNWADICQNVRMVPMEGG